ncbi:hypothetical protein ROZALSC1DRAFT_22516, partial [Rozella allomycis CSF55]
MSANSFCHCDRIRENLESNIEAILNSSYIKTINKQSQNFYNASKNNCQVASEFIPVMDNYLESLLRTFNAFANVENVSFSNPFESAVTIRNVIFKRGKYSNVNVVDEYKGAREAVKKTPNNFRCIKCKNIPDGSNCNCKSGDICECYGTENLDCIYYSQYNCRFVKDKATKESIELITLIKKDESYEQTKRRETENFKLRQRAVECRDKVLDKEKEIQDVLNVFKSLFPPEEYASISRDSEIVPSLIIDIGTYYFNNDFIGPDHKIIKQTQDLYYQCNNYMQMPYYAMLKKEIEIMEPIAHITKAHYKELLGDDVISHGIADVNLECKELDIYSTLSPKYIKTVKNQNAKFKAAAENNCQTASLIVPILDNYLKSILTVFSSFMGDEIVLSESAFMDAVDIRNAISQLGDYKDDQVVPVYDKFRKPIESPHDIRCINCKNVCEVLDCQSEIYQELDKNVRKSPVNLQVKKLETENFKLRKMAVECRDKVLDKIKEIEDVLDVFKSLFPPNALMCFLKDFRLIKLLVPRINTFYFNGAKAGSCRASIHECEISYVEYLKIRSRDDLTKLKQEVEKMEPIPYITKEQYEEFMRILGNSVNDVQEESDPDQNPDKIESQKEEISHDDGEEIVLQPDEKVDNSHVEASSDSIEDESIEFIDSLEYELQDTEEIVTQQLDALILEDEKEKIEPRTDDEQTIDEEISTPLLPVESESQEEVKVSLFENQSMEQIDNDTVEHEINAYEDEHNNASEPQKDENEKQQIDLVIHDSDDEAIEIEEPIDVNVATSQNGQEETIQTDYREECDMQRDEEVFIEAVSQNVKNQSFELREPVEFALETAVEKPFEFPKNDESIVHKDFLEVNINTDDVESQQVQISVKDESVQCTDPVE